MNVLNASDGAAFRGASQTELLGRGFGGLRDFRASLDEMRDALQAIKAMGDENAVRRVERMLRQLDLFEPSVTMIGQIKSGKTSLVNAMVGTPDLLPADVNPWTSVVTSLHLHPERTDFEDSARFRFFDEDEWDKLISGGGRIGELASRAGADDELEKIKQQVSEMRDKSRARLGRKFEMLLGQQHEYGYIDKDLIERYVCLGEAHEEDESAVADGQGRFADITKSADLSLQRSALPIRLCLRDTPGVNDTFMMREQITIRAIRDSRICVVVLSANQALTSTDLALIRLISHVKSRDVIIFVNRIDELSDPVGQVAQIRTSISETLKKHKGPQDAKVIFGSAFWALHALTLQLDKLPPASAQALTAWSGAAAMQSGSAVASAWQMSGLPELQAAIAQRVVEGVGATVLQRVASSAKNIASGVAAADRIVEADAGERAAPAIEIEDARAMMQTICTDHKSTLEETFSELLAAFSERMERVQDNFLTRATASLIAHLETAGESTPWTYDPTGLRMLLSSSHKVLARNSQSTFETATQDAVVAMSGVYERAFGLSPADISIAQPKAPQVPPPVTLGRTIALDLGSGWWKRWWMQRRGYETYAPEYYELIKSETNPMIAELREDLAQSVKQEALAAFDAFLTEQMSVFDTLDRMQRAGPEDLQAFVQQHSPRERRQLLQKTLETLSAYV